MIACSLKHIAAVNRQRRVIVNFDTLAPILELRDADLDELLDRTFGFLGEEGNQVDSIWWCWGAGNWAPHPSKVLPFLDDCDPRFQKWIDAGIDLPRVFLEETRRHHLEVFYSHRINGADNERGHALAPPLKEAHPDWLISDMPTRATWNGTDCVWNAGHWNFAVKGVRDHKLRVLREVAENYDFDGIELDFARCCPVLPPEHQWEAREELTDFISSVRSVLMEVERQRGRPFLLAARVPENIEGCHLDGLDVEAWARENLLDILVLGIRSFDVDIAAFRRITAGTGMKLYPSIDDCHASDGYQWPEIDVYRGVFSNWWNQGADGIQTFNFFPVEQGIPERVKAIHHQIYCEMGSLNTLEHKDKTFVVQRRGGGHMSFVVPHPEDWSAPRWMYCNTNMFASLPAKVANDGRADTVLTLSVADDLNACSDPVETVSLRILLSDAAAEGLPESDRLERVTIATQARVEPHQNIPPARGIEDHIAVRLNGALLGKPALEQGWLVFRAEPRQFAVGNNLIGLRAIGRPSDSPFEITIEKLEVHVKYRRLFTRGSA